MDNNVIMRADKKERTITFYMRDDFGNGKDINGLKLADVDAEKKETLDNFAYLLDYLMFDKNPKRQTMTIERTAFPPLTKD